MEELLKCQICFEQYDSESSGRKHPILFTCGHGVCNECCEEILDQYEALECPFCRSISVNKVKNRDLMKIVEAYAPVRNEMNNWRAINESMRQLSDNDQVKISDMRKENEKLTERLERVRANHREELLHWQRTNSKLDDKLEERENELAQLSSKYEQLISTHCGLLLTQINNNNQSPSSSSKRKIRD